MSYILDALRKSEQERREVPPLVLASAVPPAVLPSPRLGLAAGFMILAAAAGLGTWMYLGNRPVVQATTPLAAPPATSEGTGPRSTDKAPPPAPELKPNPFAAPTRPVVRDLAKEARVQPPNAPSPAAAAPPPAPTVYANVAATPPPAEPVKFLRAMPPEFQRSLPGLAVNIHIYAPREAERILYINNRQYRAGGRVNDDIVIEEIVEDGAVLSYRGQRFKLPRPR